MKIIPPHDDHDMGWEPKYPPGPEGFPWPEPGYPYPFPDPNIGPRPGEGSWNNQKEKDGSIGEYWNYWPWDVGVNNELGL